jgi:hypothetical protein
MSVSDMVVYVCSPSYSGGWDGMITGIQKVGPNWAT